ncbi:hypothetical protein ABZY58_29305 [Micromonospora tulbaghiae]|uniref:hypothetical protein n=1 Tax=Micromonospora tulbaghiae TaxID=479978 RepID=UPI0033B29E53
MSDWVRRWEFEIRWRPGLPGDRLSARRVDTVAELRQLVTWACGSPDITKHSHHPVRELVGALSRPRSPRGC